MQVVNLKLQLPDQPIIFDNSYEQQRLHRKQGPRENFPVAEFLGIKFISHSNGQAMAEFTAASQHANPMGTLHGGILCDLADAAMGVAFATTLQADESFTTLELKINFLRPCGMGF